MNKNQLSSFINQQIELAVGIENVRMAEKYIFEKQMNFEMQYAIDLLNQALGIFAKLKNIAEENKNSDDQKIIESNLDWTAL